MTRKYSLRELGKEDLPLINQWRNDKELVDLLCNNFLFIGKEVDDAWFENYLKNRQSAIRFAILDDEDRTTIGTAQLTAIHPINRSAEFSIMIGNRDYWSRGAGYFSTNSLVRHGFEDLNLHRIWLTVLENNQRAISLYERIGFKKEGIFRDALFKNGVFVNIIQMSLLRGEAKY